MPMWLEEIEAEKWQRSNNDSGERRLCDVGENDSSTNFYIPRTVIDDVLYFKMRIVKQNRSKMESR